MGGMTAAARNAAPLRVRVFVPITAQKSPVDIVQIMVLKYQGILSRYFGSEVPSVVFLLALKVLDINLALLLKWQFATRDGVEVLPDHMHERLLFSHW